jgi:hypothetical protein
MPRDGSGIYHQPFPDVVVDTTVESPVYNGFTRDVELDLNTPRPIAAGGTGASNAHDALIALHGEEKGQLVTNYDSHPFVNGSFYSAPGATAAPEAGSWYSGIVYDLGGNTDYVTVEARSYGGLKYTRTKIAGVWQAWVLQPTSYADLDTRYVNVSGDTMSGTLAINAADGLRIQNGYGVVYRNDGSSMYTLLTNAGDAAGGWNALRPFTINLANGGVLMANGVSVSAPNGTTPFTASGIYGALVIDNASSGWNYMDAANGTYFRTHTGAAYASVATNGVFQSLNGSNTDGVYRFGLAGNNYLSFESGKFNFIGGTDVAANQFTGGNIVSFGNVESNAAMVSYGSLFSRSGGNPTLYFQDNNGTGRGAVFWNRTDGTLCLFNYSAATSVAITSEGKVQLSNGWQSKAGFSGGYGTVVSNLSWDGAAWGFHLYADDQHLGIVGMASDYRIKKDVIDLPGMWDTVKGLRPIKFTGADYNPVGSHTAEPMFKSNEIEQWGFIAHELQDTMVKSAATAEKDAPDAVQSPNPWTLLAAVTKALQEAMARIEALEAGG